MASSVFVAACGGLILGLCWPRVGIYFRQRYPTKQMMPQVPWRPWEPVAGMVMGILLWVWRPEHISAGAVFWFAMVALLAARIDLFCGVLPYRFSIGMAVVGWGVQWESGYITESILVGMATAVLMSFIVWISRGGMGGGDIWFAAGIATWFSAMEAWTFLCIAFISGAIYGIGYYLYHGCRRGLALPFGPFLAIAGIIVVWLGEQMSEYCEIFIG